ncbi:uncharacterized protein LOC119105632 [Pollicipes pollicipes]|uniref:uncharacterized protein LOC119105632 n=1 Tax=Pollicipes pollicipes TaxID=41117 RepID=UPI001884D17A|nr:uncharacterized protein LOC119105632 [Pollicipes pollicipes]
MGRAPALSAAVGLSPGTGPVRRSIPAVIGGRGSVAAARTTSSGAEGAGAGPPASAEYTEDPDRPGRFWFRFELEDAVTPPPDGRTPPRAGAAQRPSSHGRIQAGHLQTSAHGGGQTQTGDLQTSAHGGGQARTENLQTSAHGGQTQTGHLQTEAHGGAEADNANKRQFGAGSGPVAADRLDGSSTSHQQHYHDGGSYGDGGPTEHRYGYQDVLAGYKTESYDQYGNPRGDQDTLYRYQAALPEPLYLLDPGHRR